VREAKVKLTGQFISVIHFFVCFSLLCQMTHSSQSSTDIAIIFSDTNLKLDSDAKVAETKLRQNGIRSVEQLQKLTSTDLMLIGISDSDAFNILTHSK
jgi:hypothetical protein